MQLGVKTAGIKKLHFSLDKILDLIIFKKKKKNSKQFYVSKNSTL